MIRSIKLFLMPCALFLVLVVAVAPAPFKESLSPSVLARINDESNSYLVSFEANTAYPNVIFDVATLPSNILSYWINITSDGRWLLGRDVSNPGGYAPLAIARTGEAFTNLPDFAIWASVSADSQYLFYISVDATGRYETFNFRRLLTGTTIELIVAPLSARVNSSQPPFAVSQFAVPLDGWTLDDQQLLFVACETYDCLPNEHRNFYRIDLSQLDFTRSGTWNEPKRTPIPVVAQRVGYGKPSPDRSKLAYLFMRDDKPDDDWYLGAGNAVAIQDLTNGDVQIIHAEAEAVIGFIGWSQDNRHFFYATEIPSQKKANLYRYDINARLAELINIPLHSASSRSIRLCNNTLFYIEGSFQRASIYSVDLADGGKPQRLFTAENIEFFGCRTPSAWNQTNSGKCIPFCTPEPIYAVGNTVDVRSLTLGGGNATKGQQAYDNRGCSGCHTSNGGAASFSAPTKGMWTRIVTERLKDPLNAGLTAEQYVAESIIRPNTYIVPGGTKGLMPQSYGEQLSLGELQDLIAYIKTQT